MIELKEYQKSIGMIIKRVDYLSFSSLFLLIICSFNVQSQYISSVDQYTNNLVTESPSLIGWHGAWEITGSAQRQYYQDVGSPAQTGISTHGYIRGIRTALGVSQRFEVDRGYHISLTSLALSPKLKLGESMVLMPAVSVSRHAFEYHGNWEFFKYQPTFLSTLSLGAAYKHLFGSLDYRSHRRAPSFLPEESTDIWWHWRDGKPPSIPDVADQLSLRVARRFELGKVSVLPSIRASVEDLPSIGTAEIYFVETSMNLHYEVFTLAALYDHNQRIALGAGYTFKERIRLSYAYTFIHNEEVRRHSLALRTILFKGQRKDSFIQDIGLL